jgi:hypothetical protein
MKAIRTLILAAALALVPAAASAQNFLINPCSSSDTCFGTGDARDAFFVTDGAKRIKVNFLGTQFDPMVDAVMSLGTSTRRFKDGTFSGTVTAGGFSGPMSSTSVTTDLLTFSIANPDVKLQRDAANSLAQRNGTTAQSFFVYNTYTSASNYERLQVYWTGSIGTVTVGRAGAGLARDMAIGTDGAGILRFNTNATTRFFIDGNGHFLANAANTYDIGDAAAASRPRTVYAGTSVVSPAYTVGSTAGASCSGAPSAITVVNGIVTACTAAAPDALTALRAEIESLKQQIAFLLAATQPSIVR